MKLNNPLPQSLPKECQKAARIFKSFVDNTNNGLDGVIPRTVIENAKGFAIFSIFKAGLVFSARAGSGVVIARLGDGTWSAPSAIGLAGLGVGGQLGAEITDFLIVLNSRSALKSFMAAGSLTLGGNASIALGPLGRNGEASGAVNSSGKVAAMYSYSKTRGLFGGLSIEGSIIVERQDANAIAYSDDITVQQLLGGSIEPLPWASDLINTLNACTGVPGVRNWIRENTAESAQEYAFGGVGSPSLNDQPSFLRKRSKDRQSSFTQLPWSFSNKKNEPSLLDEPNEGPLGSVGNTHFHNSPPRPREAPRASNFETHFESDFNAEDQHRRSKSIPNPFPKQTTYFDMPSSSPSMPPAVSKPTHLRSASTPFTFNSSRGLPTASPFSSYTGKLIDDIDSPDDVFGAPQEKKKSPGPYIKTKAELSRPLLPREGVARAVALYDYRAKQAGDLSFAKGDVITITHKSNSTDDWWTGTVSGGSKGIFPANFVEVVQTSGISI